MTTGDMAFTDAGRIADAPPPPNGPAPGAFNPDDLQPHGAMAKLLGRALQPLLEEPQWWLGFLRRFCPVLKVPFTSWALVTRFDTVREVLWHDRAFPVPFGPKVQEINCGPNFLLGMRDGEDYRRYQKQVMQAFRLEDVQAVIAPLAARFSEEILAKSGGRLDAIEELITRVPTLICEAYYGVPIPDKRSFGQWTIAISTFCFGNPFDNERYHRAAVAAGNLLRPLLDWAIAEAKARPEPPDTTVLARLIRMQRDGAEGLTDEVIRGYLIGMINGFVPTNTMAAGHMLEMLLRRRDFMAPTRAAALAGDDDLLARCLFETMRFMPLNLGPFRVCDEDYTLTDGLRRPKTIRRGTKLLVSTQSAMFDERRIEDPHKFNPDRPRHDYMLFGSGLHWCVGAYIAQAQITQTFKVLLRRDGLCRAKGKAGRLQTLGPFPAHLIVEFDR